MGAVGLHGRAGRARAPLPAGAAGDAAAGRRRRGRRWRRRGLRRTPDAAGRPGPRSPSPRTHRRRRPAGRLGAAADLGAPATFVLLRHGETPLTPEKRFSGSGGSDPDSPPPAADQAERVAAALAARGTVQDDRQLTAAPAAARPRRPSPTASASTSAIEDGLRETDFGAWEGLTFGEVRERYPDDLNAWLASPDAAPTGGGESFADGRRAGSRPPATS